MEGPSNVLREGLTCRFEVSRAQIAVKLVVLGHNGHRTHIFIL